jgi:hypothetical protein
MVLKYSAFQLLCHNVHRKTEPVLLSGLALLQNFVNITDAKSEKLSHWKTA